MHGYNLTLTLGNQAIKSLRRERSSDQAPFFFADRKLNRGANTSTGDIYVTISLPYVGGYWYPVCILTSQPYFSLTLVTGSLGSLLVFRQEVLCFSIYMVSTLALIHPIRGSHLYVAC